MGASFAPLDVHAALAQLPAAAWTPAYQARKPRAAEHGVQIEPRDGAWIAEATGLTPLPGWPPGTRLILRTEHPHPGAQLRTTDADGPRITGFLTNTPPGGPTRQLADLELRHRRHARVEDRIRAGKNTELRNLPLHDTDQNRIWIAITALAADLLAWTARLALLAWTARLALPATTTGYQPKPLRLRTLATAGRLARTAAPRPAQRPDLALGRRDHHRAHPTPRARRSLTRPPHPHDRGPATPADHAEPAIPHAHPQRHDQEDHQSRSKITVRSVQKIEAKATSGVGVAGGIPIDDAEEDSHRGRRRRTVRRSSAARRLRPGRHRLHDRGHQRGQRGFGGTARHLRVQLLGGGRQGGPERAARPPR
ncbi:transposase [Pseudonocardia sp. H11422]|uniref:transposase n=1 Tax=Pseudonocardia sp. H11422 TaxID=2835866 RepID=UPI001BDC1DA9